MSEKLIKKSGLGTAGEHENLGMLPSTKEEAQVATENRRLLVEAASESGRAVRDYVKETGSAIKFDTVDTKGMPIKVTLSTYHDSGTLPITRIQIADEHGSPREEYSFWPKGWNGAHGIAMFVPMVTDGSWPDGTLRARDHTQRGQFADLAPNNGMIYRGEDAIMDMGSEVFLQGSILLAQGAGIIEQQRAPAVESVPA